MIRALTTMNPSNISKNQFFPYRNVMEMLVIEELQRQVEARFHQPLKYTHETQAIAYALNRLPPLYATSIEGWERQLQKAKSELSDQISWAVRWGLAAIENDPLKVGTPLLFPKKNLTKISPLYREQRVAV